MLGANTTAVQMAAPVRKILDPPTYPYPYISVSITVGVTWLITLGEGGGNTAMGIRNFNLRSSQVAKVGKICLNVCFSFFPSLYHSYNRFENIYLFLFVPLQLSNKKIILT